MPGAQLTCFASTKVHVLTPAALHAREMYVFVMNALPSLSARTRREVLREQLLPALLRAGLVCASDAGFEALVSRDMSPAVAAARPPVAAADGVVRGQTHAAGSIGGADGGGALRSAGSAGGVGGMVLSVHTYVQKVLERGMGRLEGERSGGQSRSVRGLGVDGCSPSVNARQCTRETFVNSIALLECYLLYQSLLAEEAGDAEEERGAGAGGEECRGGAGEGGELEAGMRACSWQVEMPADVHVDLSSRALDTANIEHLHDALRIGCSALNI